MVEQNKKVKREGFRFSKRTVENLDAIVEMGLAKNRTDAIELALEHLVTEEKTKIKEREQKPTVSKELFITCHCVKEKNQE